jgi:protoheme IX farnesyltransferase
MAEQATAVRRTAQRSWLSTVCELTKVRITAVVTLSVATGYLLFAETLSYEIVLPVLGTFLLACGAAALNQVQESPLDARMPRTRNRPIPAGVIGRDSALLIAIALIGAGLTTLASIERHTLTVLALGALAVIWYNGVYVALKRWTSFAVIPGSLIGAIPPVIGWVSAGGLVTDPAVITLAMFFFIWQIPHFWLLLIWYGGQYEEAGMPSLTATFTPPQLARITCVWILSVATFGILMGATEGRHLPWNALIVIASLWLAATALQLLTAQRIDDLALPAFLRINIYALIMMAALVGNACF